MTHASYLKEKARQLRTKRKLTLDEIADRLALPRTTIYSWIRDLPVPRPAGVWPEAARAKGNRAMQAKYRRLRDEAYDAGTREFDSLAREPDLIHFVILFITEGYKRSRNSLSIANSDPAVIHVANKWFLRLAARPPVYSVQYHADQDVQTLRAYWAEELGCDANRIRVQRKSNSNHLNGPAWRSEHGVLAVTVHDTYLRSRMQSWVDRVRAAWLDS
jgi:transcriptional regulator with XRE-family HTH domain